MGWASKLTTEDFEMNGHHNIKVPDLDCQPDDYSFMLPEYIVRSKYNVHEECEGSEVEVISFTDNGKNIIAEYFIHECDFSSGFNITGSVKVKGHFEMINDEAVFVIEEIL